MRRKAVHLNKQLIQGLLSFTISELAAATRPHAVYFVDPNDCCKEQTANPKPQIRNPIGKYLQEARAGRRAKKGSPSLLPWHLNPQS